MFQSQIVWPVIVQVALTFGLLFWLGLSRVAALRRGEAKLKDVALGQDAWPERIRQIGRSYQSQLELPVLFHLVVVLALATGKADALLAALAWLFVATRLVHAAIHTTSNTVRLRFNAFLAGVIVLVTMWILFALRMSS